MTSQRQYSARILLSDCHLYGSHVAFKGKAMTNQRDAPMTKDESHMHWGLTYLREDVQELRREVRDLTREMNARFSRQTATMIALTAAIIAAVKL